MAATPSNKSGKSCTRALKLDVAFFLFFIYVTLKANHLVTIFYY